MSISTVDGLKECVDAVKGAHSVEAGWGYAPLVTARCGEKTIYSCRLFDLPKTHIFTHSCPASEWHVDFLIWCISFLKGMRITRRNYAYLDATPIEKSRLTDFVMVGKAFEAAMLLCDYFFKKHSGNAPKKIAGAMHAMFMASTPHLLGFERFGYLYTSIDACYSAFRSIFNVDGRVGHYERPSIMCDVLGIPMPVWAEPDNKATYISRLRNDMVHDALFFGEPLGFSTFKSMQNSPCRNIVMEMKGFVCKILMALLLGPCRVRDYLKVPLSNRNPRGVAVVMA